MKVYVGYVMLDYSTPVCMGLDKNTVEKELKNFRSCYCEPWIKSYDLHKAQVVEFDND